MPASARYNLSVEAGTSIRRRFTLRDHRSLPLNLWDRLFRLSIREYAEASVALVDLKEELGYFTVNRPSESLITTLVNTAYDLDDLIALLNTYVQLDIPANISSLWTFPSGIWQLEGTKISRTDIPISGAYSEAAIDVNNGFGRGVITANAGTPFASLQADDVIILYDTENGNDGAYKISSSTSTVINTQTPLRGSDNTTDTTLVISLVTQDSSDVIRYIGGRFRNSLEVVHD